MSNRPKNGLPGFLADSLPDRFGNALIDAWLARQGREAGSFNAVRLHGFFGRLTGFGPDALAGGNLDRLAGLRVAAHAGFALAHRPRTESGNAHTTLFRVLLDEVNRGVQDVRRVTLRQVTGISQRFDEFSVYAILV